MPVTLRKHWYQKLARAGFRDIEIGDSGQDMGDFLRDGRLRSDRAEAYRETEEYYRKAAQFAHEHGRRFKSALEGRIWGLHADGLGYREIARQTRTSTKRVFTVIGRLRQVMLTGDRDGGHGGDAKRKLRQFFRSGEPALFLLALPLLVRE